MKKLLYSKKIKTEVSSFVKSLNTDEATIFLDLINNYCSKLNKEYASKVNEFIMEHEKLLKIEYNIIINKLIDSIAEGENINSDYLKNKYLKLSSITISSEDNLEEDNDIEEYLEKIIIDGNNFYYQNIPDGKVYNASSKIVGVFKNNKVILTDN